MHAKQPSPSQPVDHRTRGNGYSSTIERVLTYYPLRYYVAAFVFALVLLFYEESIRQIESEIVVGILQFFRIYAYYLDGQIFAGSFLSPVSVFAPLSIQIPFLMFFPTFALTARTSARKRAKILSFGILCFGAFIVTETAMIAASATIAPWLSFMHSIWANFFVGSLVLSLSLFSIMTIPKQPKITRLIRRDYVREYVYFIVLLLTSGVIIYLLTEFLSIQQDIRIASLMTVGVTTLFFFAEGVAFLFSEIRFPAWLKPGGTKHIQTAPKPLSLSFLVPAYNEEKNIRKCIESIDLAAARYGGKTEVVVVNDGSTDNTRYVAETCLKELKHCEGRLYNMINSGKGHALRYGLERTVGDIIFRLDGDSVVDPRALGPMMLHFRDPHVGSVSGFVVTPREDHFWVKTINLFYIFSVWRRRAQDLFDAIIVQPGACTVFRKSALIKVGGWTDNIFGEDGELTTRMARFGYRNEFEHRAFMFSESPPTLTGLLHQRARWSIAYYHSRGINLSHAKEIYNPRAILFLMSIVYGNGLTYTLVIPFLIASALTASVNPSFHDSVQIIWDLLLKLAAIRGLVFLLELTLFIYYLRKLERSVAEIFYYFPYQLFHLILSMLVKPQVTEILLAWSTKWNTYSNESFKDLRREVKTAVDPEH